MPCNKSKEPRFRVYEYDLPPTMGQGGSTHDSNENVAYHDTGKEFTVLPEDIKLAYNAIYNSNPPEGILFSNDPYIIPRIMFTKVYNFSGTFVAGWIIFWDKPGDEGYIGARTAKYWHIKRVM